MSLKESQDRRFDQRTLDTKLHNGDLESKEYQNYLSQLPDESDNYETLSWEEAEAKAAEEETDSAEA